MRIIIIRVKIDTALPDQTDYHYSGIDLKIPDKSKEEPGQQ
jgi:hypothetical protein